MPKWLVISVTACALTFVGFLIVMTVAATSITSANQAQHYAYQKHRATTSLSNAVSAGILSDDESTEYRLGLQHIANNHLNVHNFTVARVIAMGAAVKRDQDHQRQLADDARAKAQYEREHIDWCGVAVKAENNASKSDGRAEYNYAVAGLAANDKCSDETVHLVLEGYLLSMKAFGEHRLGIGDWRTDQNQANALLVECQTTPGLYGTREGAQCESQEETNIKASVNWDSNE